TANALYPKYPKTGRKIPRYVLNRAILSAQNIVDLERILKNVNYGCAFGFSVNAADFSKLPVTATYNYEVAPSDEAKSIVSKITIRPERTRASRSTNIGYYYHFNMYDHYQIEQNPKSITSSQHRKARAFRLPVPRSDDDARVILGDTLDRKYPIYRTPRPTDPGCTVATGEFDLTNCKLSIYKSNPKTTKIPLVQIEIPCNNT
ncbi:beta-alanyl-dopamine/carcinine hydrolase-like, partial [Tubulanus polymorphus]|uniref:beta-alanyl-dopamine/carcinine hydrolase-like n=1 Tax=Tubulanus polymorphus TaxID=672921 RepID=UPI003DA62CA6